MNAELLLLFFLFNEVIEHVRSERGIVRYKKIGYDIDV